MPASLRSVGLVALSLALFPACKITTVRHEARTCPQEAPDPSFAPPPPPAPPSLPPPPPLDCECPSGGPCASDGLCPDP